MVKKIIFAILAIALLYGIGSFVAEHSVSILLFIGLIIVFIVILIALKKDAEKVKYCQTNLAQFLRLTDTELSLYVSALSLLKNGKILFSPHEMGVLGFNYSSTHYRNLYDKGYFDKVGRGVYAINKNTFQRAMDAYLNCLKSRIALANSSVWHDGKAKDVISRYTNDISNVIVHNGLRLTEKEIASIGSFNAQN